MSRPAVVLLSGGLDSATVLAHAIAEGWTTHALSCDYGQRHRLELERATAIAQAQGAAEHRIVRVDLGSFGGSALTADLDVPKGEVTPEAAGVGQALRSEIPITYVPARNTVFLALALAWAEALGARDLFLGVNAVDYSGYPDCRPEFLAAFEQLANLATRDGVESASAGEKAFRIHAPLLEKTKGEIVRWALDLGVDLALTTSCYDPAPSGFPCGECDACRLRARGFADAGVKDPALTQAGHQE